MVLIDAWIGSAGETFVDSLRHFANVVFLGVNTAGGYHMTGVVGTQLPNSNIRISFGLKFLVFPDLSVIEGIGFLADFWVHPDDALDLAVKFIQNYVR